LIIRQFAWENCRNLQAGVLTPDAKINVFYGENAQGKTNLLEWLWLFTGGHSFRGAKESELVQFGAPRAWAKMDFYAQNRAQTAEMTLANGKRQCVLNDVPQKSALGMVGHFCATVFAPGQLSLVQDGPAERRKFLDTAICQLRPRYAVALSRYNRVIEQRNALLKSLYRQPNSASTLDSWDEEVARLGSVVRVERKKYLTRLQPVAERFYAGLSDGREALSLCPVSEISAADEDEALCAEALLRALYESRENDKNAGFTTVGPHRDDFAVFINALSARSFGSQGQQRSAVLALKLGEAAVMQEVIGEWPVVLLDDVLSELDPHRQDYLLKEMQGWQVFLTCCDATPVLRMTAGKAFRISSGTLTPDEEIR